MTLINVVVPCTDEMDSWIDVSCIQLDEECIACYWCGCCEFFGQDLDLNSFVLYGIFASCDVVGNI